MLRRHDMAHLGNMTRDRYYMDMADIGDMTRETYSSIYMYCMCVMHVSYIYQIDITCYTDMTWLI